MSDSTASSTSNSSCCGGAGTGSSSWLNGRGGLILAATALGGAALWFGWPWLVVAGVAPLLIAFAPCLLMCGAMCAMNKCSKKKSGTAEAAASPNTAAPEAEPETAAAAPQFSRSSVEVPSAGTRASA